MQGNRIKDTEFRKLIGKWTTEGAVVATGKHSEMTITGTDTYEWILDGFFVLHKADVLMGKENSQTFEIIRFDSNNNEARFEYFNNQGASGSMTGTLIDNQLNISDAALRFRGQLNEAGNQITGTWQKLDQKEWRNFLLMKLTKVD